MRKSAEGWLSPSPAKSTNLRSQAWPRLGRAWRGSARGVSRGKRPSKTSRPAGAGGTIRRPSGRRAKLSSLQLWRTKLESVASSIDQNWKIEEAAERGLQRPLGDWCRATAGDWIARQLVMSAIARSKAGRLCCRSHLRRMWTTAYGGISQSPLERD